MILHFVFMFITESTFGVIVKSISSFAPFSQVTFTVTTSEDPWLIRSRAAGLGTFALIFFLLFDELKVNDFGLSFTREVSELNAMHLLAGIKFWAIAVKIVLFLASGLTTIVSEPLKVNVGESLLDVVEISSLYDALPLNAPTPKI